MCKNEEFIKDIIAFSKALREKGRYLSMLPSDVTKWNWEQQQSASQALEEMAVKLDCIIAKHAVFASLFETIDQNFITYSIRKAIKREIQRKNTCDVEMIDATRTNDLLSSI